MTIQMFGYAVTIPVEIVKLETEEEKMLREGNRAEVGLRRWQRSRRPWNRVLAWVREQIAKRRKYRWEPERGAVYVQDLEPFDTRYGEYIGPVLPVKEDMAPMPTIPGSLVKNADGTPVDEATITDGAKEWVSPQPCPEYMRRIPPRSFLP